MVSGGWRHATIASHGIIQPSSTRYLSFEEREQIALWRAQEGGVREIARQLERAPSTISRELHRNASTRSCWG